MVANSTGMCLSCVYRHVFAHLAPILESFTTHLTAVRFLASVYAHVVLQIVLAGKGFPTYSTQMGFYCMSQLMIC